MFFLKYYQNSILLECLFVVHTNTHTNTHTRTHTRTHTHRENGVMNNPGHIFNCDEELDSCWSTNQKTQSTLIACVGDPEYALPPITSNFDNKGLNSQRTEGEVEGTAYGLNGTGWIDSNLFAGWFQEVFLKFIPAMHSIIFFWTATHRTSIQQ